jgi:hypothetical protein
MLNLTNIDSFFQKNSPKKLIYRRNMQPETITRREYKGKIYVKNNKFMYDPKQSEKSDPDPDPKKILPCPQH